MGIEQEDKHLIEILKAGDHEGFTKIYKEYFTMMASHALVIVGDPDLANEITQQTMIHLWTRRRHLRIRTNLAAYLAITSRNAALNFLRNEKKKIHLALGSDLKIATDDSPPLEAKETQAELNAAIARLPPRQKMAIRLYKNFSMSYKEIATFMRISENAVGRNISGALRNLRKYLKN